MFNLILAIELVALYHLTHSEWMDRATFATTAR